MIIDEHKTFSKDLRQMLFLFIFKVVLMFLIMITRPHNEITVQRNFAENCMNFYNSTVYF